LETDDILRKSQARPNISLLSDPDFSYSKTQNSPKDILDDRSHTTSE
jgi:hypothetical protein